MSQELPAQIIKFGKWLKKECQYLIIIGRLCYAKRQRGGEMYSYVQVEAALMRIHAVAPSALTSFRGRVNNLKRLGVIRASSGRGKKITYDNNQVLELAICLQLLEFGLEPSAIKQMLQGFVGNTILSLRLNSSSIEDSYIVFFPNVLSSELNKGLRDNQEVFGLCFFCLLPESQVTPTNLRTKLAQGTHPNPPEDFMKASAKRIALINVSELVRDIDAALAAVGARG